MAYEDNSLDEVMRALDLLQESVDRLTHIVAATLPTAVKATVVPARDADSDTQDETPLLPRAKRAPEPMNETQRIMSAKSRSRAAVDPVRYPDLPDMPRKPKRGN